ncbi:PEPxxWA-CTERM sorting domain-containing protein [Novosphingobium piscinae]|uniref:PEP-CTERM sorting domain-containing protein n=1 Tax=Novosphingobium piscinae TaxID=1507448 RepID=A0A7X1FX47_9SPHN|nr:PEPxxWA-CTERM sorting domain-containing protein [Novosphingobium piscinae]MBC2667937.1 PEP-CTERM sorting domain-containing protein [Novosphingobium piscinae]
MKTLTKALLAATSLLATQAHAATIVGSATGIAAPATTITFSELALAPDAAVTNQFAGLGLTVSPNLFFSPQTNFPNITGGTLGNFTFNGAFQPGAVTFSFGALRTAAAFAMASNSSNYTFESLLGGSVVESFTANVGSTSANNFYGFTNSAFDSIRITNTASDFFLVDNLQLSAAGTGAVPEPSTWAMMLIGFGCVGAMLRRKPRQTVRLIVA